MKKFLLGAGTTLQSRCKLGNANQFCAWTGRQGWEWLSRVPSQRSEAKGAAPVAQGFGAEHQSEWRRALPACLASGSAVWLKKIPRSMFRAVTLLLGAVRKAGRARNPRHGERGRHPHAGRSRSPGPRVGLTRSREPAARRGVQCDSVWSRGLVPHVAF